MFTFSQTDHGSISGTIPVERSLVIMKVGSTVNLECSFEAPGEYKPEWSKDGHVLCAGPKYAINMEHQSTSLIIKYAGKPFKLLRLDPGFLINIGGQCHNDHVISTIEGVN